ncbi:unnamed protein product [Rhizoctonia solani]|uniref:F-box domain-containing protein n=1 Tax=Rhizoctonia solani TaxID=456999 RepID=A0A8H3H9K4_9AGAM|nr:unnamed protein product [Rhizoctonia solani]
MTSFPRTITGVPLKAECVLRNPVIIIYPSQLKSKHFNSEEPIWFCHFPDISHTQYGPNINTNTNCGAVDNLNRMPVRDPKLSIDELPYEILVLVFDLVLRLKPCRAAPRRSVIHKDHMKPPSFQRDPVILSQVCSHWRRTAINTPSLWTHIDIQPRLGRADFAKAAARWDVYVQRSDSSLLDIHIFDPSFSQDSYDTDHRQVDTHLHKLVETIAPRTQSLSIRCFSKFTPKDFPRKTMATFMRSCVPGVLKALDMRVSLLLGSQTRYNFTNDPSPLGYPEDKLESLYQSIISLDLRGYYPKAGSKAYCGLVELCLQSPESYAMTIPESILVEMIKSNPRLRVLKFNLRMIDISPREAPVTPIRMGDLQVVGLGKHTNDCVGEILRWLCPGLKPLSLSVYNPQVEPGFIEHQFQNFIAQSNITKLGLHGIKTFDPLDGLITMVPDVKVLAIDNIGHIPTDAQVLPKPSRSLDAIYVIPPSGLYSPSRDHIEWLARYYDVQKLTVWTDDFEFDANRVFGTETTVRDVHAPSPVINITTGEPNPVAEWY